MMIHKGGIFAESFGGGRSPAEITLEIGGVRARTPDGAEVCVPFSDCHIEIGGASGRMVFCRDAARSVTIYCEGDGFLADLESFGAGIVSDQIRALKAARRSGRRRAIVGCSCALFIALLLLVGGYFGLMAGARAMVGALPVSIDQKIGEIAIGSMELEGPIVKNPVVLDAIGQIVDRLTDAIGDTEFEFEVRVIDAPVTNAFALPGGYIVVYSGLIDEASSPEQVAGVLAHEIAHVTRRHGLQRVAQSMGVGIAFGVVFGDANGIVALATDLAQSTAQNAYSRDHEAEADAEAVGLMHAAGLDPEAMCEFFQQLEQKQGDLPRPLAWISTHPQHADRIASIRNLSDRLDPKDYSKLEIDWGTVKRQLRERRDTGEGIDEDAGDSSVTPDR